MTGWLPALVLRRAAVVFVLVLAAACSDAPEPGQLSTTDIEENNRGVGLMGYFDYEGARQVFERLAAMHPGWHDVHVNLAIATLNRQQPGDEATALGLVEAVMRQAPDHLRARYVAGLLSLNAGNSDEALAYFSGVSSADPSDAYAAYYTALCLAQLGETERALAAYRRALTLDPYLRSAYYGAFQALQKLRRRDEARAMLEMFQKLAGNPQARLAEFKYTRMGEKGAAQVVDLSRARVPPLPEGPLFASPVVLDGLPPYGEAYSAATLADVDADGRLDLYLPATAGGSLLATGRPGGDFAPAAAHPLSGIEGVRSALWGDLDNDGLVDVYLLRNGPNQLWMQTDPGRWEDRTSVSRTSGGDEDSIHGLMLDADHDGDLDLLVVNAGAPLELFNNNLDGSYRKLAQSQGLAGDGRPARAVLATDIDSDRDVDLVVIYPQPPHSIFLNDRLWSYVAAREPAGFLDMPLQSVVAADLDADGRVSLIAASESGALLHWHRDEDSGWIETRLAGPGTTARERARLALADLNGDGRQELVYSSAQGWIAATLTGDRLEPVASGVLAPDGHWLLANLALPEGPALLGLEPATAPRLWRPGTGRHPFLGLSLTGREEQADSMRSNASGLGARIDIRTDSRWSVHNTLPADSGPGQSLQPVFVGLAGHNAADYIAIHWSDGVFQTELGLVPGKVHALTETQRQLSSCPVLFGWDGNGYAFISDLLGVGGIGFNTGFGEYAQPRPWEWFLLPRDGLLPKNGVFSLKITEPMEEVAYIDSVALHAIALPPGWGVVPDERMGLAAPLPTGRPVFYREERIPIRARNDRGEDVSDTILRADGVAAPVGEPDRRFIGRLAREHVLEFEFDQPLDGGSGPAWLIADGWVEYPYSQTGFAAWQAGAGFHAPTLEAAGSDGTWRVVAERFGYPAGMPRRMALPLAPLPPGTTRLRLRTNLEVYWDRLAVAIEEPPPEGTRMRVLPLLRARVEEPGFPRRIDGPQRRPDYDFSRRQPLWDTRHPRGNYTAFGDATPLVTETDDAVAIIGPGEGLALEFDAAGVAAAGSWLLLETRGWAKDMDMFTLNGGTVGPLPSTGLPADAREALHSRYNTRPEAGF